MHFDAEVVDVRINLRQCPDDFARTEPDLEATRRRAAIGRSPEGNVQIDGAIVEIESIGGPKFGKCPLLRRRDAAGAQHVAADAALSVHNREVCLI